MWTVAGPLWRVPACSSGLDAVAVVAGAFDRAGAGAFVAGWDEQGGDQVRRHVALGLSEAPQACVGSVSAGAGTIDPGARYKKGHNRTARCREGLRQVTSALGRGEDTRRFRPPRRFPAAMSRQEALLTDSRHPSMTGPVLFFDDCRFCRRGVDWLERRGALGSTEPGPWQRVDPDDLGVPLERLGQEVVLGYGAELRGGAAAPARGMAMAARGGSSAPCRACLGFGQSRQTSIGTWRPTGTECPVGLPSAGSGLPSHTDVAMRETSPSRPACHAGRAITSQRRSRAQISADET